MSARLRQGCVSQRAALSDLINRIPEIVYQLLNWCGHWWGGELMLWNRPATYSGWKVRKAFSTNAVSPQETAAMRGECVTWEVMCFCDLRGCPGLEDPELAGRSRGGHGLLIHNRKQWGLRPQGSSEGLLEEEVDAFQFHMAVLTSSLSKKGVLRGPHPPLPWPVSINTALPYRRSS